MGGAMGKTKVEGNIGEDIKADEELDARGLKCPLPVIRVRKKIDELKPGDILLVMADDPGAKRDFPAFCKETGHTLLKQWEENGVFKFLIEKKG